MSYVRQIHKEAMAKVKLANAALVNNDLLGNSRMLEEAYLLEKEAAQLLADEYETEPTRSVLFRSAASLAIQVGAYSDAMDLIKTGLNGNTHHEIKEELFGLLKTIDEKVLHEFPVIRQEAERLDAPIDLGEGVVLVTHNSPVIIVNKAYQVSQVREPAPLSILQVQLLNLLRLQEYFKKSFKGYQADVLMSEAQVQASIEQYIQSKHTLISAAIGKADTLSVWYAANYFMELYAAVNRLEADGVRVYFCAYEEDHLEHSLRTCLAIVPTKKTADGGHSNILSERQPGFVQGYSTNRLPAIYVPSQLLHQRVQNYLAHQYPILSKAIGKADTRCVWYSKDFLENVLSGMAYFNANGVRLCLGSTDSPHDFGRTTLITVLTHEHHDNTVNLVYNEYAKMANGPNHEAVKGQIMAYWGPILEYAMSNNDI